MSSAETDRADVELKPSPATGRPTPQHLPGSTAVTAPRQATDQAAEEAVGLVAVSVAAELAGRPLTHRHAISRPGPNWEPVGPVATEVVVQVLVGVDAEELPDTFEGEDLAVGQGGLWAALAQPLAGQQSSISRTP
jgi:hypothetical protein